MVSTDPEVDRYLRGRERPSPAPGAQPKPVTAVGAVGAPPPQKVTISLPTSTVPRSVPTIVLQPREEPRFRVAETAVVPPPNAPPEVRAAFAPAPPDRGEQAVIDLTNRYEDALLALEQRRDDIRREMESAVASAASAVSAVPTEILALIRHEMDDAADALSEVAGDALDHLARARNELEGAFGDVQHLVTGIGGAIAAVPAAIADGAVERLSIAFGRWFP